MIHTIKPEVLTKYINHLVHRCIAVKDEIERAYQLSEINRINEKREDAFLQCLPRFKPREEDINEQYLDDYFGNIEYVKTQIIDFGFGKMTPTVTVDYEKIDLDRELSAFLYSESLELGSYRFGVYHEALTFLHIRSIRPVFRTKFNDVFNKIDEMGLSNVHNFTNDVHLSKKEVQFLKELENNLTKAEEFLEIETPMFYQTTRHFEDVLPY